jgi:lipopolysaccharide transport system permease protein
VPYAVSTFCALAPWQLFSRAVTAGGDSLVANQALVTKTYLPRLAVPLAPVIASLVDFAFAFAVLVGLLCWYGIAPGPEVMMLPLLLVLTVAASLGVALWLAAVNALYRDVRLALPFLLQLWMLVTPVVYAAQSVLGNSPRWVAMVYALNPMVGAVEGFRFAVLGGSSVPWSLLSVSSASAIALLASGTVVFRRLERVFADQV